MFDSPFLRRKLVWPLSTAAIATFVLAIFAPVGGLFVNLGTTFVGILLTVGYVDLVLKEHRSMRWSGALARIRRRIDNFATMACTQFRIAFGFGPDIYNEQAIVSSDERIRRAELARIAKQVLRGVAEHRVAALDSDAWKKLCEQLRITWNSADRLIELYNAQLEPEVISALIDFQDRIQAIIGRYTTFPDILGVPDDEVKPNRRGESALPLKRTLERLTVEDVRAVFDLTVELCGYLDEASSKDTAA